MNDEKIGLLVNKLIARLLPTVNRMKEGETPQVYIERTGPRVYFDVSRECTDGFVLELETFDNGLCQLDISRHYGSNSHHAIITWLTSDKDWESMNVEDHGCCFTSKDEDMISLDDFIDFAYADIYEVLTME